ncbi:MAG: cell division protein ZapA [Desulfobacterales bacterium]|nr:cell division protein ZapA [Desulfobacterales bacterium]
MEEPIRVKILNKEYLIKSNEEEERVQEIAKFINNKFKEINERTGGLSEEKIAILAAFHFASEYFQVQKDRDDAIKNVQERARTLNYQIDSIMR